MPETLYLTPLVGMTLVFVVVVCGHRFRLAWKDKAQGWVLRAWIFGTIAGLGLLALAFIPLRP